MNGTMKVVAGDADATDIKLEILVEVPTNQALEALKYDDKNAQTTGEITLRVRVVRLFSDLSVVLWFVSRVVDSYFLSDSWEGKCSRLYGPSGSRL